MEERYGPLRSSDIENLIDAALQADLFSPERRRLLLSGLSLRLVGGLPLLPAPIDQMRSDLTTLNRTSRQQDGSVPITTWLLNAEQLAGLRPVSEVFRQYREKIEHSAPASTPDAMPPAPDLDRSALESLIERVRLDTRELVDVDLSGLDLSRLDLSDLKLVRVRALGARLDYAQLTGAHFVDCDWSQSILDHANLSDSSWARSSLCGAKARTSTWRNASVAFSDLTELDLTGSDLTGATIEDSGLGSTRLDATTIEDATIRRVQPNHRTTFTDAVVRGCRMDRASLEALSDDYGGLQRCHRMAMRIEDPLADLRASFSGIWAWIHLLALVAFVAPYALFVVRQSLVARAYERAEVEAARDTLAGIRAWLGTRTDNGPALDTIDGLERLLLPIGEETNLLVALFRFVWSGGDFSGFAPTAVGTFALLLAYNISRGILLWRTKSLEHQETVSGLPVKFIPDRWTRALMWMARWGTWVNLGLVVLHSALFLLNTRIWL